MYQYIEFINGSNPYISKTEKDFKWMCEHYILIPIAENFWKATDRIYYKVVALGGLAATYSIMNFNANDTRFKLLYSVIYCSSFSG